MEMWGRVYSYIPIDYVYFEVLSLICDEQIYHTAVNIWLITSPQHPHLLAPGIQVDSPKTHIHLTSAI